jgi:hypothetical protein
VPGADHDGVHLLPDQIAESPADDAGLLKRLSEFGMVAGLLLGDVVTSLVRLRERCCPTLGDADEGLEYESPVDVVYSEPA